MPRFFPWQCLPLTARARAMLSATYPTADRRGRTIKAFEDRRAAGSALGRSRSLHLDFDATILLLAFLRGHAQPFLALPIDSHVGSGDALCEHILVDDHGAATRQFEVVVHRADGVGETADHDVAGLVVLIGGNRLVDHALARRGQGCLVKIEEDEKFPRGGSEARDRSSRL